MTIIFVFAHPTVRQKAYKFFWSTHSLYVVLYTLCLIHGLARLTGAPRFWIFFVGPAIIYALDKVILLSPINTHVPISFCIVVFSISAVIKILQIAALLFLNIYATLKRKIRN